jgi:hypothetical protein
LFLYTFVTAENNGVRGKVEIGSKRVRGPYPRYFSDECANTGLIFSRVKKSEKE